MNKMIITMAALLLANGVLYADIENAYEEKPIQIQKAGHFDADKQVEIQVGEKVVFKIKIYQGEFFGETTISANAHIDNTTAQKVKAIYSISFHDKDGKLVGCHQGHWDMDPKEDINYGSGIIYADAAAIASVTSYKLKTQVIESKE